MTDYVHVSAAHLIRLFKSVNKKNYIDYLNEIRVENAKTLLAFSETKATNIAYEVGYESYPYFLKVFTCTQE